MQLLSSDKEDEELKDWIHKKCKIPISWEYHRLMPIHWLECRWQIIVIMKTFVNTELFSSKHQALFQGQVPITANGNLPTELGYFASLQFFLAQISGLGFSCPHWYSSESICWAMYITMPFPWTLQVCSTSNTEHHHCARWCFLNDKVHWISKWSREYEFRKLFCISHWLYLLTCCLSPPNYLSCTLHSVSWFLPSSTHW
jgi:hypothetical protein